MPFLQVIFISTACNKSLLMVQSVGKLFPPNNHNFTG